MERSGQESGVVVQCFSGVFVAARSKRDARVSPGDPVSYPAIMMMLGAQARRIRRTSSELCSRGDCTT